MMLAFIILSINFKVFNKLVIAYEIWIKFKIENEQKSKKKNELQIMERKRDRMCKANKLWFH